MYAFNDADRVGASLIRKQRREQQKLKAFLVQKKEERKKLEAEERKRAEEKMQKEEEAEREKRETKILRVVTWDISDPDKGAKPLVSNCYYKKHRRKF